VKRGSGLNDLDVRSWMRFTKSWFVCNPPPRTHAERNHPAKFPEVMAGEFIRFFTRSGETVLDPFCGVGSAVTAAATLGRRGIGIEISPEFHEVASARVGATDDSQTFLLGDANRAAELCCRAGVERVHYILTSPPYWDMLLQGRGNVDSTHALRRRGGLPIAYTDDPADLGRIGEYGEFVTRLTAVFAGMRQLLAPSRYLTVVLQNVRVPSGAVRPLAWDLARSLSDLFTFKGERLWLQDNKRLGCWGWPSEFVTNVHHHYCLVFKNDRA
jgi:SAM-dependent methyltransferase